MPPDPFGPPGDLDTDGKALYRKLRKHLEEADMWEGSDKYIVGQTCRYEQRARIARAGISEDGTALGYKGQIVQHPNLKTATDAEGKFVDGLKELGLTPAARKRLQIETGGGGDGDGAFGGRF